MHETIRWTQGQIARRVLIRKFATVWMGLVLVMTGCGASPPAIVPSQTSTSVVTPSASGSPNSVTSLGTYEFVSVQETGQIFTYDISSGAQVQVGQPYATPCGSPSGMVIASIAGTNVMAVTCYDTGFLLTLTVHADGSLTALGSVGGFGILYPGIVLDGTNVLIPLFQMSGSPNGGVAKVSIASPTNPVLTGTATLALPGPGAYGNPGFLTVAGGNIFVAAGSEYPPAATTSTIQVVNEATMTLVGSPLVVAHSPQKMAIQGNVAYVTFYDATQLESIDVSNPASMKPLQIVSLTSDIASCHAIPVLVRGTVAYIGCYAEGILKEFDVSNPSNMGLMDSVVGIAYPESFNFSGNSLLITGAVAGGHVYDVGVGATP